MGLELMGAAPDSGGGGQGHMGIDEGGRSKKTGRKLPVSNRPDPMPADLEFLFTKITPEQSMYMWRFLSCVFLFQCILVFVYAGLLHLGNFWAVTIPWGIVVWYTAIQHIYVDHDVMHGATFPPYWWQKFLTHPFSEPFLSLPWEEFIFEHMKHHTSTIDLLTQGEFGWDPEMPLYWLMENKFNFITAPIGVPLAHFIGLNDTGMTFALEWFMHMPEAGAGGKCNKDFWSKWFPRRLKHCAFIWGVWSCVWLVGELMSPVGGWTFFIITAICNRCGYGTAWAFITNFTHSHPWQNFLTGIGGGRTSFPCLVEQDHELCPRRASQVERNALPRCPSRLPQRHRNDEPTWPFPPLQQSCRCLCGSSPSWLVRSFRRQADSNGGKSEEADGSLDEVWRQVKSNIFRRELKCVFAYPSPSTHVFFQGSVFKNTQVLIGPLLGQQRGIPCVRTDMALDVASTSE